MQHDSHPTVPNARQRLTALLAVLHQLERQALHGAGELLKAWRRWPVAAGLLTMTVGLGAGIGGHALATRQAMQHVRQGEQARRAEAAAAQRELNAMSARLSELQAQTTRLNALGQRLAEAAGFTGGEFDFSAPAGRGGVGPVRDVAPAELRAGTDALRAELEQTRQQWTVLDALLMNRDLRDAARPTHAPMLRSYITSRFGARNDPFGGGTQFHKGIDFAANVGDPVLAAGGGVVTWSGERSGYGLTVEIDHGDGYVTRYAHNSRLQVQVGDLVRAGQRVADAGSTGRSTGAHVHLEVWKEGQVIDPLPLLADGRLTRTR